MSKIIGTGLSGLVGSRVVDINTDFEFKDASLNTGIDILNKNQLFSFFNQNQDAKAVIHFAAFTDTTKAWEQRGDKSGLCYQLNVVGTQNIVDLCRQFNKYLIHVSTDFVFDGTKTTAYTEEDQPKPIEWYGETKYEAEKIVQSSGINYSIVRISYPYRTKFDAKLDIIRKIISKFQSGETLKMFTDQITTTTFIDDIANGLNYLFNNQPTGIYHLVGSSSQSPYDMALTVADVFDFERSQVQPTLLSDFIASQPANSRPWQKSLILSNQKVSNLGIKMKTLKEGLMAIKEQYL